MIKNVAIYLRKSRDKKEEDDILSKHRDTLVELCKSKGWNYRIYEEIASGERIAYRPVVQELLEAVEDGEYDAVLVMDIDRLGRGNNKDWGVIYESFCNSEHNTLIVTPQKTYDLTSDSDEMMVDFQSLIAKMEYKTIKRRFKHGKTAGAKQGKWVCGVPPYPYVRNNKKTLDIDEEKYKVYRLMIDKALSGESIEDITLFLNNNHIPSPKNGLWTSRSVSRLLTNEIHLGYMIYGKTKGDTRKNTFAHISKNNWIKVEATHESVKTIEEHHEIIRQIQGRRTIPVAARAKRHMLSGILYCKKCGYRMNFKWSSSGYFVAICSHKYPDGTRCQQIGYRMDLLNTMVSNSLFDFSDEFSNKIWEESQKQSETLSIVNGCKQEIAKIESALEKIHDLYEDGEIDKQTFIQRKNKREQQKQAVLDKINELESTVINIVDAETYFKRMNGLRNAWDNAGSDSEKNEVIHYMSDKMFYDRQDKKSEPTIEIHYK